MISNLASNDTEQCAIKCPLECAAKNFFGTISFSQISSQATSNILGTYEQLIETSYRRSLELSNRLNPDKNFMWYLKNVASQTSKLSSYIRSESTEIRKYKSGLMSFNTDIVKKDMQTVLKNTLQNYTQAYENDYRRDRLKAITHLNNVISISEDLVNEFSRAPIYFTKEDDATAFFTSLYTLLSNGLTSVRMSQFYLSQARVKEDAAIKNASFRYIPSLFYATKDDQTDCFNRYTRLSPIFDDLEFRWRYASERVFYWLQTKTANCSSKSLATTQQETLTSTVTFETPTTVQNLEMTTELQSLGNSETTLDSSSDETSLPLINTDDGTELFVGFISGLWDVLSCAAKRSDAELLKVDWVAAMSIITQEDADSLANCLLAYEKLLYALVSDILKPIPDAPEISVTDALSTALRTLDNDVLLFNREVYNYLVDAISKAVLANKTSILLQNMSVDIEVTLQSVADLLSSWQTNITSWQTNISIIYTNVIDDLLKFSIFFPQDADLASAVSDLNIWLKPVIIIEPSIKLKYTVVNQNLTKKSIAIAMQKYLTYTAQSTMSSVLNNLVTTIVTLGQMLTSQAQLMSIAWTDIRTSLEHLLDDFTSSLTLDETFMQ